MSGEDSAEIELWICKPSLFSTSTSLALMAFFQKFDAPENFWVAMHGQVIALFAYCRDDIDCRRIPNSDLLESIFEPILNTGTWA